MAHRSRTQDTGLAPSRQASSYAGQRGEPASSRPMLDDAMAGFSWLLVTAIGLLPLAEASLHRAPSVTMPTVAAFFVAVASGILLRRRYSWLGVVLHIYGQIAIWLSLFVMSLAAVLVALGHP